MSNNRRRWSRFTASQFVEDLKILGTLAACGGILVVVDYIAQH